MIVSEATDDTGLRRRWRKGSGAHRDRQTARSAGDVRGAASSFARCCGSSRAYQNLGTTTRTCCLAVLRPGRKHEAPVNENLSSGKLWLGAAPGERGVAAATPPWMPYERSRSSSRPSTEWADHGAGSAVDADQATTNRGPRPNCRGPRGSETKAVRERRWSVRGNRYAERRPRVVPWSACSVSGLRSAARVSPKGGNFRAARHQGVED